MTNPEPNARPTPRGSRQLRVAVIGCGAIGPLHAAGYAATGRTDLVGVAEEILAAGSSVLLEKPPCLSLKQMDAVAQAEAESAGQVYVVFQHRHGSGARRAQRLLAAGALGRPQGRGLRDAVVPARELLRPGLAGNLGRRGRRTPPWDTGSTRSTPCCTCLARGRSSAPGRFGSRGRWSSRTCRWRR